MIQLQTTKFSFFLTLMLCIMAFPRIGEAGKEAPLKFDVLTLPDRLLADDETFELCPCESEPSDGEPATIGRPGRTERIGRSLAYLEELAPHASMVPFDAIFQAITWVPTQNDSWSCGINSAARFSAMLGRPIEDYRSFLRHAPYHGGFWFIPKIGVNAEGIQDYLREQPALNDFSIGQRCTRTFHPQWVLFRKALSLGRPAMVLVVFSGTSMHWVNLIARDNRTGNWLYMETNGKVFEILGDDDELSHWMNASNCAVQRHNSIERFNSVTSTL